MFNLNWEIECNRYFIETGEKRKSGNPVMIPIYVRKLHITGNFIFTNRYQVNVIKRSGEFKFCVKQLVKIPQAWWIKTPPKTIWEKEGSYTKEEFVAWLKPYVVDAEQLVVAVLTCPPQNVAA